MLLKSIFQIIFYKTVTYTIWSQNTLKIKLKRQILRLHVNFTALNNQNCVKPNQPYKKHTIHTICTIHIKHKICTKHKLDKANFLSKILNRMYCMFVTYCIFVRLIHINHTIHIIHINHNL